MGLFGRNGGPSLPQAADLTGRQFRLDAPADFALLQAKAGLISPVGE
jgi:hypothetical protein